MLLVALLIHLWGLQKMLPILPDVDEGAFVNAALHIASSGDLNPGWYGTPGSTLIYPLAGLFRLWHALMQHGMLLRLDPNFTVYFTAHWWEAYYLGRLLVVAYSVATLPLIVHIGRRTANLAVGLAGAWLYLFCGPVIYYAKMVRSDAPATFFSMLALYLLLRLLDRPARRDLLLARLSSVWARRRATS